MKHLVHILPLLLLTSWLTAQGPVQFSASTDAKQVVLGNYFELSFTLVNGNGNNFTPPALSDFNILGGPNQSTQVTSVNGQWSRKQTFSYTLQPKRVGTFNIGAATIRSGGQTYNSRPLSVEVVKGKNSNASTQKDLNTQIEEQVYIRAEVPNETARVGEQLLLDYKLYTTRDIETYHLVSESEYPGFYAEEIRRFNGQVVREVIDGTQYSTKVLKRVALFPQQEGTLTIDPMVMQLAIVAEDQPQRRRSFLFTPVVNRVTVETPPLPINVKPLPPDPPVHFSGAVGRYRMNTTVNRSKLTTDESINLRMTITGTGDIKRMQPPNLELPPQFELYEPRVVEENSYESNGQITGKKTFEFVMLPKEPGQYELTPGFSFYHPDSMDYITIAPQTYFFNVTQGTQKRAGLNASPTDDGATLSLRPPMEADELFERDRSFYGSMLFWILLAIPLLILIGAAAYKYYLGTRTETDPVLLKNQKAQQVAKARLSQAKVHLEQQQSRAFYDEISRALFGYVSDKLNIPYSDLNKSQIRQKLTTLGVSEEPVERLMEILQVCEMALFAGKDNLVDMESTYTDSLRLVSDIEKELS